MNGSAPPSLLHVIAPTPMGGAERVVYDCATGQLQLGYPVSVLTLLDHTGPEPWLVTSLRSAGVETILCRVNQRNYGAEVAAIRRAVQQTRAAVLHCHGYRADILGLLASWRLAVARVSTAHGYTAGDWKNRLYELLDRRALRRFDGVVVVSAGLRDSLLRSGVNPNAVHLVQNGFRPLPLADREEARNALGIGRAECAVGWIGRLSWEKGPDVFIEAVARLRQLGFQAALLGDGPERGRLQRLVDRHEIGDRVHFLGSVPDAGRYLVAFDLIVLSSRTEGLPISLLEAMNAAVPVVATSVGEIPAVAQNGSLASLVQPDDPGALSQAMGLKLDDLETARRLAADASESVRERFGLESWLERLNTVYEEAVRRRG